jgi:hypothetical protein
MKDLKVLGLTFSVNTAILSSIFYKFSFINEDTLWLR